MNASEISNEDTYLIEKILPSNIDVNLLEIGIQVGKSIKLLQKAPFGGSMAFEIENNTIFMRPNEAASIIVKHPLDGDTLKTEIRA